MATPATAPITQTLTGASALRLQQAKELWTKSKEDRDKLGRLLYEERNERLSGGGRGIHEGFHQWLRDAGIPKAAAYRRIAEYEISIGIRKPEEDKPVSNETSLPAIETPEVAVPAGDPVAKPAVESVGSGPIEVPAPVAGESLASGNFWEALHDRLNPLVPSFSDGVEHKTVVMLRQALTEPANTQAEKHFRKYTIELLDKISKNFSEYAQQLKYAEVVQVEQPTTSGELAYQIDHSAPNFEAAA